MNAENSVDLFLAGRMGTISEGVTSLLEGRKPSPPPSRIAAFLVYAVLFGIVVIQLRAMTRSVASLRRRRVRSGRVGPRVRIGLSFATSIAWGFLVLVLVPKQLGLSLFIAAQGLPDVAYVLMVSGVVAVGWGIIRAVWASAALRHRADRPVMTRAVASQ